MGQAHGPGLWAELIWMNLFTFMQVVASELLRLDDFWA